MNSIQTRQIVVVAALTAILCIAILVGLFLIFSNIIGAHSSQINIMLIAPSYITPSHQFVDLKVMASAWL